jgi:hypothetical protein
LLGGGHSHGGEAGVKTSARAARVRDLLRPRFVPVLAGLAWRSLGIVTRGAKKPRATMSVKASPVVVMAA